MMTRLLRDVRLPWMPIILVPLLLWLGILVRGESLFWGTPALQFVPWQITAWSQFRQGIIPLWNSLNGMGAPLVANYQLAWFYPPSWLVWPFAEFGGAPWIAWADTLLVLLHTIWAGLGLAKLLKRIGVDPLSQTIGGLAFSLSSYFIARSGFFSMIWAGAWIPWVIFAASDIAIPGKATPLPRNRVIYINLILTTTMQLLAGHAQLTWYTILLTAAWVLIGGWQNGKWRGSLRAFILLGVSGIVAIALSAIQLFPTVEYLLQSQRSAAYGTSDLALTYSFWPWRLLTLLVPDFFGNPANGNYWGYASFWEDAIYIGIIPLGLALSMIFRKNFSDQDVAHTKLRRFLWVIALVGFFLALGHNTPVYLWLYENIPTFNMFQAPARWMVWPVFSLSILAGLASHQWGNLAGRQIKRLKRILAGLAAVVLGAVIAWLFIPQIETTFTKSTVMAGLWAFGAGLLLLLMGRMKRRYWELAVITWISMDLLCAGWAINPTTSINFFASAQRHPLVVAPFITGNRSYLDPDLEYLLKFSRFLRFGDFREVENWSHMRIVGLPNLNLLDGVSSVNNFDPLVPYRYSRWMAELSSLDGITRRNTLAYMGVKAETYYDTYSQYGLSEESIFGARRLHWYSCLIGVDNEDDAWERVWQKFSGNAPNCVIVEDPDGGFVDQGKPDSNYAQVSLLSEQPNKVILSINSSQNGWLVLADLWYPYWKVFVDGHPVQLLRADYLFRGVSVSSGYHTIEFVYLPLSFQIGVLVSLAGWAFVITMFVMNKKRVGPHTLILENKFHGS